MSSRVERFRKRKSLLNNSHSKPDVKIASSPDDLSEFLASGIDYTLVSEIRENSESFFNTQYDLNVSENEINDYLKLLDKEFNAEKYGVLFDSTKDVVVDQLLKPLGLSRQNLASNDVDGGPVTTLNNFKQGVTANSSDATKYQDWQSSLNNFDDSPYRDNKFVKLRKERMKNDGPLKDGYTGREIPKDGRSHLEHITSAHTIESDPISHLGMNIDERVAMANSKENLTMIDSSMNQSKGDKDLKAWQNTKNSTDKTKTNGEYYNVDEKLVNDKHKASNDHINKTKNFGYHSKLAVETCKTSLAEAKSVGLQQAIGSLFSDLITAIFQEVKDSFQNGFRASPSQSFWDALKERLKRIAKSVIGNWQSVINALKSGIMGAISGFVSNICTVIINTLVKTSKNIVRLIREGFMSLMKALKLLLSPPNGMTFKEAAHEASKLLGAGLVVSLGIFAEEAISTYLTSIAIPFANIISVTVAGIATGLGSLFVVLMLDKLDLFGVVNAQRGEFIQGKINADFDKNYSEAKNIIRSLGIVEI